MAWIVKPSGTMQIERRGEPYLDDALKAELTNNVLHRYPTKQAATLPALHAVQHKHNWLPYQAIEEIAAFLELEPSQVYDTATFYEEFFLEPKGKYLIQVCQSIACELCGYVNLEQKLRERYDIVNGETTDDGKLTLQMVECLGMCDDAPAVLINGKMYKKVSWDEVEAAIDGLPDDPARFDAPGVHG